MWQENEYFSRIEPVLGQGLAGKRVAWLGLTTCTPVIEMLAACRLHRFAWVNVDEQAEQVEQSLRRHNHLEAAWEFKPFSLDEVPDLLVTGGSSAEMLAGLRLAEYYGIPAVLFGRLPSSYNYEAVVLVCRPDANLEIERRFLEELPETDQMPEAEVSTMVAAVAKALLLKGTPYARSDYDYLFSELGRTVLLLGNREWPWQVCYSLPEDRAGELEDRGQGVDAILNIPASISNAHPPIPDFQHVAIFGCGGLGSLIAKEFSKEGVDRFSLVDGGEVNIFHPVRQFYHTSQIGQPKVYALTENLLEGNCSYRHFPAKIGQPRIYQGNSQIASYNLKLNDNWLDSLERLVAEIAPDLGVITTGTDLDFYLARAFQKLGKPYVVARCYPRARYFELIFSLPREDTPCFDCLRGHLYIGPQPSLTLEEQARYDTTRAVTLEAEPATLVETSRAAQVAVRLGKEILGHNRASWFQALVEEGQTCLIGANEIELTSQRWAYGLSLPGQVAAFGLKQLFGINRTTLGCATCGRNNKPTIFSQLG